MAVLGAVVRDQLFGPGADPTGQMIRIRNQPFRVTGVLTRKGQAALGQDRDDTIVVPNRIWKDLRESGFEREAIEAVRRAKFRFGSKHGSPAALWTVVPVEFRR